MHGTGLLQYRVHCIVDTDKKLFEKQAKFIEDFKENIQMKTESPETLTILTSKLPAPWPPVSPFLYEDDLQLRIVAKLI